MNIFIKGLIIALLIFVADQWSKFYVFSLLDSRPNYMIELTPFLNFVKVYNYGVSFGMFNELTYGKHILSIVAIIITIILLVWLKRTNQLHLGVALGLIIGGAVGNIYDRMTIGAVADFIDFYVGNYHWPAFNIADSAVFVGVAILLIDSFVNKENKNV